MVLRALNAAFWNLPRGEASALPRCFSGEPRRLAPGCHLLTLVSMPEEDAPPAPFSQMNFTQRLDELARIVSLSDPVLRNLLITQRYHDLSHLLAQVLGADNANWSTFATWASKTAGQSIREEEVPVELARVLKDEAALDAKVERFYHGLPSLLKPLVPRSNPFDLARAIIKEVAVQIAEGNLKVFAELAPLFVKFVERFSDPQNRTPLQIESFLAELRPGPAAVGGQGDLKTAFDAYVKAANTSDPVLKAQLILYGNVLIGLHEQTRLQVNIAGGIDAPFSPQVYATFFGTNSFVYRYVLRWVSGSAVTLFVGDFKNEWQRIATRFMMKLSSPNGEEIPLGCDLPGGEFCPALAILTLEELVLLMKKYDPDLLTTKGSAAIDWVKLPDRMRFIGELFRIEQPDVSWFEPPFSPPQRAKLERGELPPGPL